MKILYFDAGIEQILSEIDFFKSKLPESMPLIPGEIPLESHLNEVFYSPSIEETIAASLAPQVKNKEILIASNYHKVIEKTYEQLKDSAQQAVSEEEKTALTKAIALVQEEMELVELLQSYRQLLLKG
ncbi:MAG TPA: hypothetical protein VJL89_05045 [Thermodesulfovibrionia bacterium]|nr:hypothetical protein [Thermodesulfovibrionia bacterium]